METRKSTAQQESMASGRKAYVTPKVIEIGGIRAITFAKTGKAKGKSGVGADGTGKFS